jgi:hypothetical protein
VTRWRQAVNMTVELAGHHPEITRAVRRVVEQTMADLE